MKQQSGPNETIKWTKSTQLSTWTCFYSLKSNYRHQLFLLIIHSRQEISTLYFPRAFASHSHIPGNKEKNKFLFRYLNHNGKQDPCSREIQAHLNGSVFVNLSVWRILKDINRKQILEVKIRLFTLSDLWKNVCDVAGPKTCFLVISRDAWVRVLQNWLKKIKKGIFGPICVKLFLLLLSLLSLLLILWSLLLFLLLLLLLLSLLLLLFPSNYYTNFSVYIKKD